MFSIAVCENRWAFAMESDSSGVFLTPQIEIEIPASDLDKEYTRYVNQWYPMENVNIYIDKRVIRGTLG